MKHKPTKKNRNTLAYSLKNEKEEPKKEVPTGINIKITKGKKNKEGKEELIFNATVDGNNPIIRGIKDDDKKMDIYYFLCLGKKLLKEGDTENGIYYLQESINMAQGINMGHTINAQLKEAQEILKGAKNQ